MKRRIFNVLAAVSLVLCVATVALWVRSESAPFSMAGPGRAGQWEFGSFRGQLALRRYPPEGTPIVGPWNSMAAWEQHFPTRRLAIGNILLIRRGPFLDFNNRTGTTTMLGYGWGALISYWPLTLALAALPFLWLVTWWHTRQLSRRSEMGRCRACGYDLRATPERCPECGTVPVNIEAAT